MALASSLLLLVISHLSLLFLAEEVNGFNPRCRQLPCENLGNLSFPFTNQTNPDCGLFMVDNCNKQFQQKIQLEKGGQWFYIRNINQDNSFILQTEPFKDNSCGSFQNLTISKSPLYSFEFMFSRIMFNCTNLSIPLNFDSLCNESNHSIYLYNQTTHDLPSPPAECSLIQSLVTRTQKSVVLLNIYTGGFFLKVNVPKECYDCYRRGRQCLSDSNGNFYCSGAKIESEKKRLGLELGITAAVVGLIIILTILLISSTTKGLVFLKKKTEDDRKVEAFLRNFRSLAPKNYNYSDVKRMTKSFSEKLGQGGYGDVYKGKLPDGRLVAVKFLKESKGNGEEFINEVASICRTSHVNIVTLFGFCHERSKRALIYEFMPNGSLDKFKNYDLEWKKMYQIAVGIARGLEYLHRGCATRIVHFDIKPHNILLDEDFCPKIADFGLAKLCKKKQNTITRSKLGARGTIGYIAPEIIFRDFREVSHKSDVYSYGMMILEMVGGRENIDIGEVSHTSDIYFPNWIYKQIEEPGKDFEFHGVVTHEEKEVAKKMILVSLWCIQTITSDRPSMTRVLEMLEGGLENLQVPPKPSFSTRTGSPHHFPPITSTTESNSNEIKLLEV